MYPERSSTEESGFRANACLVYSARFRLAIMNQMFLPLVAKDASLKDLHWRPMRPWNLPREST
ncbi:hypothetical protein ASPCADRAFT_204538 [Aspergillus carbonarius ITEM 5010]|uniref:Uncharacterized protein n=1 Tax=Aspergillus carbonarius (strain ITEM 5010) TaxID=602072 RepID=A0A1R3RWG0_ASPC5|nr:hypothetical protein ASPCADRAFT_204538 [Aspergillus carbonarius ITEM 5010]